MKTQTKIHSKFICAAAISAALLFGAAGTSLADDHYRHDRDGYWGGDHHYHGYGYYHHHRGYWDQRSGVRVWINI